MAEPQDKSLLSLDGPAWGAPEKPVLDSRTSLGAGVIPLEPGRTRYTLPSGRIADARPGKGKDLRLAARMVGEVNEPIYYEFALVAIKVLVDGRPITLEDLEEMSDTDAAELLGIARGKALSDAEKEAKKAAAPVAPSPPST